MPARKPSISPLLDLKGWLTVAQAAQHLTAMIGGDVSEADILQLGLEQQVPLSMRFLSRPYALRHRHFDESTASHESPGHAPEMSPSSSDVLQPTTEEEAAL